ncbi:endolytic transglycosylase MltG [Patescibacteria group bacterium]|nr:MAG: endolytic transglycosylase MltG [Patescibacteria group bacterium]
MKRGFIIFAAISTIAALVLVGIGVTYGMFRAREEFAPVDVAFTVAPGESAASVARRLKQEHVIFSSWFFRVETKLKGSDDELRPGTYTFRQGSSMSTVIDWLTNGRIQERTITLIEGWGIREMGEYLVVQGALKNVDEWYAAVGTPPSVGVTTHAMSFSDFPVISAMTKDTTLEGFLFPDTYRIAADATAKEIARRMLVNFEFRFPYAEVERLGKTPYEVVTLASIIEREVRSDEDRKIVADIFQRRLKEGMALQADSTVNYVTGKKTPSISSADRDIDSPWNTYQNRGLPPSPISNPSLSAIKAVLAPTPNPYVYFLTDAEGQVHYARTFSEHVANKERYLR